MISNTSFRSSHTPDNHFLCWNCFQRSQPVKQLQLFCNTIYLLIALNMQHWNSTIYFHPQFIIIFINALCAILSSKPANFKKQKKQRMKRKRQRNLLNFNRNSLNSLLLWNHQEQNSLLFLHFSLISSPSLAIPTFNN